MSDGSEISTVEGAFNSRERAPATPSMTFETGCCEKAMRTS